MLLGLETLPCRLHSKTYGTLAPPQHAQLGGNVLSLEDVAPVFVPDFTARAPSQLRLVASVLYRVLGHTLLS